MSKDMFTYKTKFVPALIMIAVVSLSTLIPIKFTLVAMITASVFTLSYPIVQSYDINYKYWFSFVGQFLAFITVISAFVSAFIVAGFLFSIS